jgi:hypothetical protein
LLEPLEFLGGIGDVNASSSNEWRHLQFVFNWTGNIDPADKMITTMDLVNVTGGLVDNSWTSGDYTTCDAAIDTMISALGPHLNTNLIIERVNYYRRAFTALPSAPIPPGDRDHPFTVSGPPDHVRIFGGAGSGGAGFPSQVSVTTTERTAYPRHWGRNYWPGPKAADMAGTGQLSALAVDAYCQAVHDAYQTLSAAEFFPVVPVTQMQKAPFRGLLSVSEVQVDSVLDVVRRRRAHTAAYKKVLPL